MCRLLSTFFLSPVIIDGAFIILSSPLAVTVLRVLYLPYEGGAEPSPPSAPFLFCFCFCVRKLFLFGVPEIDRHDSL